MIRAVAPPEDVYWAVEGRESNEATVSLGAAARASTVIWGGPFLRSLARGVKRSSVVRPSH